MKVFTSLAKKMLLLFDSPALAVHMATRKIVGPDGKFHPYVEFSTSAEKSTPLEERITRSGLGE